MANGAPQANSEEVFAEIGAVLRRLTHYLSPGEWDIKRLNKMAEQLLNADEAVGSNALATVWQMTGDRNKAVRHIDNAIEHAGNKPFHVAAKVSILCNLGYFSEALAIFKEYSAPEKGNMTNAWKRGYLCGAFRTMNSYLPKAKKMQFELGALDIDTAVRAANVTEKAGVSDEDVAKVLDVAGAVLRKHKLFFVGEGLRVNVFDTEADHDPFIEISFDLEVSSSEAHSLYQEFVDQVTQNVPVVPSVVTVSFRPWKQQHERNAA
jgi:hypothetical protein